MKTPPTMAQVLGILSVIVISLLAWGISVETRFAESILRIQQNEKNLFETKSKLDKIDETTLKILLELKDKEDRKDNGL